MNAERNGVALTASHADWRGFAGRFDLVLGADLLYEGRNGTALLELLPRLASTVLLAEPGRSHAKGFFESARASWEIEPVAGRVYRLTRAR